MGKTGGSTAMQALLSTCRLLRPTLGQFAVSKTRCAMSFSLDILVQTQLWLRLQA